MKKNRFTYAILGVLFAMGFISCSDVLEPSYLGWEDDEDIWESINYTHGVLDKVYDNINGIRTDLYGVEYDYYTDNAVQNNQETRYAMGGDNASYYPLGQWDFHYLNITQINQYLENGLEIAISPQDTVAGDPVDEKLFRYGEAHFLRAWAESELLKQYAGPTDAANTEMMGIPLLRGEYTTDEIKEIPRSTFDQCVEAIINDLDTAIKYCPFAYDGSSTLLSIQNKGRATQRTAIALKARVLLLAASPAFNLSNDLTKWNDAALAAYDAIMMDGGLDDLGSLSDWNNETHTDIIWKSYSSKNNNMENSHFPPSYYGNGRCNPSQNLVDAFPMANGCPIDDSNSEYKSYKPYDNRDARFDQFIAYDGDPFYGYKTLQTYEGGDDAKGGLRNDATRTSYYMQRFTSDVATDSDPRGTEGKSTSAITFVRLLDRQEVYLNFIEAANESESDPKANLAGTTFSAYDVFQKVKARGGADAMFYTDSLLNNGLLTQSTFREIIKNERRIEFCFRGFRYWDLRRWMEPLTVINEDLIGMKIERDISSGVEIYNYTKETVEYRRYRENTYYGPLPYTEVAKSNALIQNYGW